MADRENIVVLTGAGISAESGVATFRDKDGIWSKFDWQKLATPEAFERDQQTVYDFYNTRRHKLREVAPNPAHEALARLEREWRGGFTLITQNIDNLHERAGSQALIHMHGEMMKIRCAECETVTPYDDDLSFDLACRACGESGRMRPHVVWFGEMPLEMEGIYAALQEADLFVAIGTSGAVYPAAGFAAEAQAMGARTLDLNLEDSDITPLFDAVRRGPAGAVVPEWVEELLDA